MADPGTIFCISGAVLAKAGKSVPADISGANVEISGAYIVDHFIKQAESFINVLAKNNYSDDYATLNNDVRLILEEAASNLAAIYCISYDMNSYTTRQEAEDMIDLLWARFNQCLGLLMNDNSRTFIEGE